MNKRHKSFELFSQYSYYLPDIGGVFFLTLFLLLGAFLGNLTVLLLGFVVSLDFAQTYGMVISYPLMFVPAMLYASAKSRAESMFGEAVPMNIELETWTKAIVASVTVSLVTLASAFLMDPISAILPPMPEKWQVALENMAINMPLWASLLSVSVFAPFFEEWLCRGMVLRGLLKKVKPVWAIVISAAFFGLIHLNPWQAIPAFALGLLFGYVYYKTNSLKLTMLMHCVNNTFSVLISRFLDFGSADTFYEALPLQVYILLLGVSALIVVSFFIFRKKIL